MTYHHSLLPRRRVRYTQPTGREVAVKETQRAAAGEDAEDRADQLAEERREYIRKQQGGT